MLRRSTGELTYFATDIAYHADKLARGFDLLDRHLGPTTTATSSACRRPGRRSAATPDAYEIVIMQLVNLLEGGEPVQMSKRAGEIVTLDDLIDDIGVDAARWFLVSRSHDTRIDLDLELAREQSQDNPVYYVQYAHARIASILRKAGDERVAAALREPTRFERGELPSLGARAGQAAARVPRRGARGGRPARAAPHDDLRARDRPGFSAFYRDCRVVGAAEEGGDEDVRIAICVLART